jgi:hypothetical protein
MTDIAVHPEFAANGGFGHLRLGRNEPPADATPKLELDPFVGAAFTPPPDVVDYYSAVPSWPMYGNDDLGDCTWAAIGHMVQAWTAFAGAERTPAEADIVQGYWETGTPPSATGVTGGPTDNGRMEPHVLSYWRHNGIPNEQDSIIGYAAINAKNPDRVKFAIENFGGVYVALAMPLTAEQQSVWDYVPESPDNQPYSWGGHAVPVLGYDAEFLYLVTWGFVMKMTWAFWQHYGVASYALISPDFVGKATAAGVDMDGVQAQIGALTSGAAGGDLPAQPADPAPGPTDPSEPVGGDVVDAPTPSEWHVAAPPLNVETYNGEVGAKTVYLKTLADNPDMLTATPVE